LLTVHTTIQRESATSLTSRLREARRKAIEFMLDSIGEDGPLPAGEEHWRLSVYYRLPWTLAVCGETSRAAAVLGWAERNALTETGDLAPDVRGGYEELNATYPLSNLAMGAWLLQHYETANRIMDTLAAAFQDPVTGGAYSERPDHRGSGRQHLFPTAQLGMSALMTGQIDVARAVARWLRSLWDAQPELPDALYSAWEGDGLVLEWEDTPVRGIQAGFYLVTRFQEPRQAFYNPGIAAAFLSRFASATGDAKALELAQAYLKLSAGASDHQYDHTESKQVCKFAWGASAYLDATGDATARGWVERMANWFLDSQEPDGRWHNSSFLNPTHTLEADLGVTIEFALHLTTILAALGGDDGHHA
jgi:hypothetical protein